MTDECRELLYEDAEVCFMCDHLVELGKVAMHLNIAPGAWSPSRFKRYRDIFQHQIVPYLKQKSYGEVYATPFENDVKARKLIAMFGLHEYGQNMGLVLMKKEI
jgi:hypothetical protein